MTSGPTLPPGLRQLGSALADALDNLTTRAIGLDPVALARIAALDGRVLAIEAIVPAWPGLKPGALRFTLTFEQQALRVRPGTAHEPDAHARVRGPLPTLIGWLTSPKATLAPDLELEGDLQLIEAVMNLPRCEVQKIMTMISLLQCQRKIVHLLHLKLHQTKAMASLIAQIMFLITRMMIHPNLNQQMMT